MWVIILFIPRFSKKYRKNHTFYLFLLVMKKDIPHFKFAQLDNGYSGVYLQKCKTTRNPTLLIESSF